MAFRRYPASHYRCRAPQPLCYGATAYLRGTAEHPAVPLITLRDGASVFVSDLGLLWRARGNKTIPALDSRAVRQAEQAEARGFAARPGPLYHATTVEAAEDIVRNGLKTDRPNRIFATLTPQGARRAAYLAQGPGYNAAVIEINPRCLRSKQVTKERTFVLHNAHARLINEVAAAYQSCDPKGELVPPDDFGLTRAIHFVKGQLRHDLDAAAAHGYMEEARVILTKHIPPHCLRRVG